MSDSTPSTETVSPEATPNSNETSAAGAASTNNEPPPSYVKLAMRNMVKKGGTSIYHFALTTLGLLALLVGLAYLTR